MKNQQKINAWFGKFDQQFQEAIPTYVGNEAELFFKSKFDTQEWDGVPWKNLSPGYAKQKNRPNTGILTRSRALFRSIGVTHISPRRVVISAGNASVPYARIHNEGLKVTGIRNVRTFTNTNFMGKGKPVKISAHKRSVNYQMPRRQFIGHSPLLNNAIRERLIREFNNRK